VLTRYIVLHILLGDVIAVLSPPLIWAVSLLVGLCFGVLVCVVVWLYKCCFVASVGLLCSCGSILGCLFCGVGVVGAVVKHCMLGWVLL